MALIIRIDVDRPYGRSPWSRHFLSRVSSDLYFPRVAGLGYLAELQIMLTWLNQERARAYVFFRGCTLPSTPILELLDVGGHEIGLHLEDSRSLATFVKKRRFSSTTSEGKCGLYPSMVRVARSMDFITLRPTNQRNMWNGPGKRPCGCSWAIWKILVLNPRKLAANL